MLNICKALNCWAMGRGRRRSSHLNAHYFGLAANASRVTLETLRNIAQEHVIMFSILRSLYVSERDANIQYDI